MVCIAPPSEPDWRISRIRLSSRWFYLNEDWSNNARAFTRLTTQDRESISYRIFITHAFTPLTRVSGIRSVHTESSIPAHCLGFFRLISRQRHYHGLSFCSYGLHTSTFLRPFSPSELPDFFALMDALTPARRALRVLIRDIELPSCSEQVSPVHKARPSMHSVTNHQSML